MPSDISSSGLLALGLGCLVILMLLNVLAEHIRGVTAVHDLKVRVAELRKGRIEQLIAMGSMSPARGEAKANASAPAAHAHDHSHAPTHH